MALVRPAGLALAAAREAVRSEGRVDARGCLDAHVRREDWSRREASSRREGRRRREAQRRRDRCGDGRRREDDSLTDDPFAAVIFDLDGVLVDTEIWWDETRQAFASRRGLPWTVADRAAVMGQNSRGWSVVMRDRLGITDPLDAIEREVVEAMVARFATDPSPAIPGAIDTVARLGRRYRLGLASSAHPAVIAAALRTVGLEDAFAAVVSSDDVANGKPLPDVYLLAAERLGAAPTACLVIEDSLNGVLAARSAGMTVVLVPNAAVPPAPGTADAADLVRPTIGDIDPAEIGRMVSAGREE